MSADAFLAVDWRFGWVHTGVMAFGTFTAYGSFSRVRISSPAEALAYSQALPAATKAGSHWQAAIAATRNADTTEVLVNNARDAFRCALTADNLFVNWSDSGDWL